MTSEARNPGYSETWLDVVAAVEHLDATHRPGLTVWDALAEAVRWWVDGAGWQSGLGCGSCPLPWSDPDPLRTAVQSLLGVVGPAGTNDGHDLPTVMDSALRNWLDEVSGEFNDAYRFSRRAL